MGLMRGLVCLVFSDLSCCVRGLCPLSLSGLSVAALGGLGKVGERVDCPLLLIYVMLGSGRENEELFRVKPELLRNVGGP